MTVNPRRSKRDEATSGIVRVRLTAGDEFDAGFLVRILREHPEVEILGSPEHRSGGRVYARVRVRRADVPEAVGVDVSRRLAAAIRDASRDNGEPPRLRRIRQPLADGLPPLDDEEDW